jgi:hypothetical protein
MELPLTNTRKLWKIMFDAEDENRETINAIRDWMPRNISAAETAVTQEQNALETIAGAVERARQTVAAFGSAATKEQKETLQTVRRAYKHIEMELRAAIAAHVKAQKLQTIFDQTSRRLRCHN